jgi:hypothetical protein
VRYTVYSDNLALIQGIGKQLQKRRWYPNDTISSEWDVLQAIIYTLEQFLTSPAVEHDKGHQDSNTAYTLLSLKAQLNVDADAAATLFQDIHRASRYNAPPIAVLVHTCLLLIKWSLTTMSSHYAMCTHIQD